MKQFKRAFCLVVPLLVFGGCAHEATLGDTRRELDHQDTVIRELTRRNEDLMAQQGVLQTNMETLQAENLALKDRAAADRKIDAVAMQLKKLEADIGRIDAGVTLIPHRDGVAIEVAEIVLFRVGKAELRPEGKRVLTELAARIAATGKSIRVEGHTDSQPVRITKSKFPFGNLQLSGRRALVVADFLLGAGGLPAERVSFAGYGKHRPVAANDTPANMSRNRRVEIVLLNDSGGGR